MIIIEDFNKDLIGQLDLHDAEVSDVICNYANRLVKMPVILHSPNKDNVKALLEFKQVSFMDISFIEPWGAGYYINEITTNVIPPHDSLAGSFSLEILLNSGDKIRVVTQKLIYTESL